MSIDSFVDSRGNEFANRFKNGVGKGIPIGSYTLAASSSQLRAGFRLEVSSSDTWFSIGFESAQIESDTGRIVTPVRGQIKGIQGTDDTRCLLSGVYFDLRYGTALRKDGRFDFGYVAPSEYTLACFAASRLLFLQYVRIEGGQGSLELNVPSSSRP